MVISADIWALWLDQDFVFFPILQYSHRNTQYTIKLKSRPTSYLNCCFWQPSKCDKELFTKRETKSADNEEWRDDTNEKSNAEHGESKTHSLRLNVTQVHFSTDETEQQRLKHGPQVTDVHRHHHLHEMQRNIWHCHNSCVNLTTGWAKKMCHSTFVHTFANYWPIFKILSLAHSADNLW